MKKTNSKKSKKQLPRLGLRSIKTAISTTLCAIIYILIDRNPTFACIGAVFGMDNAGTTPWKTGGNRLIGTVIGGVVGIAMCYAQQNIDAKWASILLLTVGIILLIYVCQLFGYAETIPGAAVVFYIIMLNTPSDQYVLYAINRMIDTAVGVGISVGINVLMSRKNLSRCFKSIKD